MAEREGPLIEAAGWKFFIFSWIVLTGPCIYMCYRTTYSDTSWYVYIGLGFLVAGGVAAILTTVVNSIIQARLARIERREQEQERKKKKKKKK